MFGQKFGHLGKTKSLEEDKLGFPQPSLSTVRGFMDKFINNQDFMAELFDDVEIAERAGEIGRPCLRRGRCD
jgi:hypothetical protein